VSCPHAHQQNGAAERKHRHIVEVGLSLLAHSSVPLKYWDEAFLAATYLINRTPAKTLKFSTPLEVLFHEKLDYSILHVFGCPCWPNLHPYNTRKLAFRSKRCAFLGYSNMHKGFKCLDVSTGRIYISRDVVFDEQIFPFATLHANAGARLSSEIELLSHTLFNSSLLFGSTVIPNTDVVNISANPAPNPNQNLEENPVEAPVLAADSQGETNAPIEVDPPAPARESASAPANQPAHDTREPNASPCGPDVRATDTEATRRSATGPGLQAPDTDAKCRDATGPISPGRMTSPSPPPLSAGASDASTGSGAAAGSGVPSPMVAPPAAPEPDRPHTRAQSRIHHPKWYTDGTIRYGMAVTSEPTSVADALSNANWKKGYGC
jgi:hypothetical protein